MQTTSRCLSALVLCAALGLSACTAPVGPAGESEISRAYAGSDSFSDQDFECLREAIYYEAAALDLTGGRAVANVIMNRAKDPRFPNTICGVVAQGEARGACQFSYRCDGRAENFGDRLKFEGATRAAEAALSNPQEDVTDGALFFHARTMRPGWFATLKRTITAGGNIFYASR